MAKQTTSGFQKIDEMAKHPGEQKEQKQDMEMEQEEREDMGKDESGKKTVHEEEESTGMEKK